MGSHGRGPLGPQRDPMGGDPWEREPLGAQGIPWEGFRTPHGRGTLGSPRDPMGGGPGPPMGGEPLGAQGIPWEGILGAPFGNPFKGIL